MSWVTVIWSMVASACLTLALVHGLVWLRRRGGWEHAFFALLAAANALVAAGELWMMRAETPKDMGLAIRWVHVPSWVIVISLVGFVRLYMRAGLPWLAWGICGVRTLSLILNFVFTPNLNYRVITAVRHVHFLGESVSVVEGVANPWMLVGQASLLMLIVFVLDATLTVWRRGDRRQALLLGGVIILFTVASTLQVVLVLWGIIQMPVILSLFFLGILGAMGFELSDSMLRAAKLSDDLQESETRFRDIADSAPALIWMSGPDKLCTFFNKPWLDFTGRSTEQEKGNGWAEGVYPDDLPGCLKTYTESFDARQPFTMQYRLRRHDGEYHWFSDNGVPRYDAQGGFIGYIGCCMDINEQRKDEEEMRRLRQQVWHADRVTRTGAITASLAHELNQPLAAILSNAQAGLRFMAGENPDLAQIREILGDIVFDDKRAATVISGLRAMLRRQLTQRNKMGLAEAIQEILDLLHSEFMGRNVEVRMRLESDCVVVADKAQIQQVILNLAMNAAESMQNQPSDQRRLEVVLGRSNTNDAQVAVCDCGPGVPDGMGDKLFEAFWSTKAQGMGIGLPICRSIIESHGGRMWFANNPDRGTTFYFILPREKIANPGKQEVNSSVLLGSVGER